MGLAELLIVAVGLSMDAFAAAVGKGLSMRRMSYRRSVVVGAYFGGFQAFMPLLGYLLGVGFSRHITNIDHWIAFFLLGVIGARMIWESRQEESATEDDSFDLRHLALMALATSIDALAVGVTFAFLHVDIVPAVLLIGATTFLLSLVGVKAGSVFGAAWRSQAEAAGGLVLIAIGFRILLGHLGIIGA
ncbi:MAG: manganese efflux pump MntP [Chloroflexota bacterium]